MIGLNDFQVFSYFKVLKNFTVEMTLSIDRFMKFLRHILTPDPPH